MGDHGLLEQPVEQDSSRARGAAIEAENELVQVGVELGGPDRPLVSTENPALEKRSQPMDPGQGDVRWPFGPEMTLR